MGRLIIVSNRLPITIDKQHGELMYHPSAGGLATGLNSLDASIEKIWVGWPGRAVNDLWEQAAIRKDLSARGLIPVFLSKKDIKEYYEGFSNKTIWPHFHYFTQYTAYSDDYWQTYQKVNKQFADAIFEIIQPDDMVWVHDYQLLLLPALIRQRYSNLSIGFFLHIPFPSYELFRMLPWRAELLNGVLGADQIGFHTYGYMRHFLSAVYRIGGYEHSFGQLTINNRRINVDVFPMGIDYQQYAHPQEDLFQDGDTLKIKELGQKQKLILSIDRLDYTKGIPQRLKAFAHFLQCHPTYRGRISLILVVVPSRSNVDQYQDLKGQVDNLVGKLNGQFGTFDWVPIQYFYRSLDFKELLALYQVAQIAMITPLRDGMNLVAKEYVASKEQSGEGVLILSEMAGAANELIDAVLVNPQDSQNMSDAILQALEMPAREQKSRLRKMQGKLKKYTVKHWADTFIKVQNQLMEQQRSKHVLPFDHNIEAQLLKDYRGARRRLLVLDYDGTLMNFNPNPQAVIPDDQLLAFLETLAKEPGNQVVLNSGRDRRTMEEWLGHLPIDMAAEHGVWTKRQGAWAMNAGLSVNWKKSIIEVLDTMVERTPGSFIEEKEFSVAWHYRRVDKDFGEKRIREFRDLLLYLTANLDLQVLEGNKVVEVKNAGVNKGIATRSWLNQEDWDFILAIGDDHTDEDTFQALPETAYSIKVGMAASAARYHLLSVEQVRGLLQAIIG